MPTPPTPRDALILQLPRRSSTGPEGVVLGASGPASGTTGAAEVSVAASRAPPLEEPPRAPGWHEAAGRRTVTAPAVCRRCRFYADDACSLLAALDESAARLLLTEGLCEPRHALAGSLRRAWSRLGAEEVDELAAEAEVQLLDLARQRGPEGVRATLGGRAPDAYLFAAVTPPHGWAYRNLLRRQLRRLLRRRQREAPAAAAGQEGGETSGLEVEPHGSLTHPDALARLLHLDPRAGLLMRELLVQGEIDRELWRHVLGWEDELRPSDVPILVEAVAVRLGRASPLPGGPGPAARQLAGELALDRPRTEAAVTNALTLARYKLLMLLTGTLDELLDAPQSPEERGALRALAGRHFTRGVVSETQAWATVVALGDDRGPLATKQLWRACYRRGAEESLRALTAVEGLATAMDGARVGFRRVLGLPPEEGHP